MPFVVNYPKIFTFSFICSSSRQRKGHCLISTQVKVTERSKEDKLTVKQIVALGKHEVYDVKS